MLFLILFLLFAPSVQAQISPKYEVYALSYGTLPDFPVADLVQGADKDRKLELQMMIWLIKGRNGKNILVDSGCYHDALVTGNGIQNFIKPSETLQKLGMSAAEISDVIISHMHWDHADGMDLFPNAKIWIQQGEYEYYTGAAWQADGKHGGIEPNDVMTLVGLNLAGKVNLVDGDREIIEGIHVYIGGRHTYASQYVSVNTASGVVVIASDNMYLYENLEKHAPIAQTFDAESNLRAQDRMKQIASRPDLIVPGHDPAVFTKFPKPGNRVAKIE